MTSINIILFYLGISIFFFIVFVWLQEKNNKGNGVTNVPPPQPPYNVFHYNEGNYTTKDLPILIYVDSNKVPEKGAPTIGPMLNNLIRTVNSTTRMLLLRRPKGKEFWGNYTPNEPNICIQFVRGEHGCRSPFDGNKTGSGGNDVLAHATKSRICVDLDNNLKGEELEQVLIHELGHCLGMGHVDSGIHSIMAATVTDDRPFPKTFTKYDVDVLHYLFPDRRDLILFRERDREWDRECRDRECRDRERERDRERDREREGDRDRE